MNSRMAFTARFWGESAVVCRSLEDRPGPAVAQEFGQFETWTQANTFASRLNEGLDLDSSGAQQIVTSSMLQAAELLRTLEPPPRMPGPSPARVAANTAHVEFTLAELNLALSFCRLVRTKLSIHTPRLLRNARNALFNAMDFLLRADLTSSEVDQITAGLHTLHHALQEFSAPAVEPANPPARL